MIIIIHDNYNNELLWIIIMNYDNQLLINIMNYNS